MSASSSFIIFFFCLSGNSQGVLQKGVATLDLHLFYNFRITIYCVWILWLSTIARTEPMLKIKKINIALKKWFKKYVVKCGSKSLYWRKRYNIISNWIEVSYCLREKCVFENTVFKSVLVDWSGVIDPGRFGGRRGDIFLPTLIRQLAWSLHFLVSSWIPA